ncbi:tyrosine-type recombinase/integrase [Streptomyces sp. NBC_01022]|uniref:tyrosine-type recombinase/integrase n=1 Tax=Streptomyces sp. NBC_01022 TaxID=2903723 RepID=UPI002DD889F1|nr:integrase [Streptomyces sp. NBC_01022]WRZ84793.1 integrase [Streptomyces sp. NBC_01022]
MSQDQHIYVEWRGGTCRVKWWTGDFHENGRKRHESKGGFTDETEAFNHGRDKMYEIRHGTHVSNRDGATRMSDWLDDWLNSLDHAHLTEKGYRSKVETHIRPYFRRMTVADVDVIAYRAFRKHINSVVGAGTAKNVMMVLGMILDDAAPKLIATSPVERNRKRGKYTKKTKERKRDLSPEVVERLALNAEIFFGYAGYVFIWTMASTGMRPAELYALTREYSYPTWPASDPRADPDEVERYAEEMERYGKGKDLMPAIRVERQVQHEKGELRFFPPKYGSYRTLVVPPYLAEMLEKLLASHDSKWVFPAKWGGSLGSVAFDYEYWRPIADGADARVAGKEGARKSRAAMPEVPTFKGKRLYLLRHGHKAWLDEDAHSEFAVETRMGHEVRGMGGVYGSLTVAMERAIMKALQERYDGLLERLGKPKS